MLTSLGLVLLLGMALGALAIDRSYSKLLTRRPPE